VVDVLFLRQRRPYLVELFEAAKQIFNGLQGQSPGLGGGRRGASHYLMQTARTCGISVIP